MVSAKFLCKGKRVFKEHPAYRFWMTQYHTNYTSKYLLDTRSLDPGLIVQSVDERSLRKSMTLLTRRVPDAGSTLRPDRKCT